MAAATCRLFRSIRGRVPSSKFIFLIQIGPLARCLPLRTQESCLVVPSPPNKQATAVLSLRPAVRYQASRGRVEGGPAERRPCCAAARGGCFARRCVSAAPVLRTIPPLPLERRTGARYVHWRFACNKQTTCLLRGVIRKPRMRARSGRREAGGSGLAEQLTLEAIRGGHP